MKRDLLDRFKIDAKTLYDKPKESFGPIDTEQSHELFLKLGEKYTEFSGENNATAFTQVDKDGQCSWILRRPAILISSTSWTEDEDFGILLEALLAYDNASSEGKHLQLPKLLCVITGKGPQKEYYRTLIDNQV